MARISYVEYEKADPNTKAMYDKVQGRFQMVLNIGKVMGHHPQLMSPFNDFIMEILKDGQVDWKTKELLILKSTLLNQCHYCVVQHETLSKRLGISEEKIAALEGNRYKTSSLFTDPEKTILEFCEQVWKDANRVSDDLWARIKKHYSEPQIIEILATITAYIMVSKFGDALQVELEPVFEGIRPLLLKESHQAA